MDGSGTTGSNTASEAKGLCEDPLWDWATKFCETTLTPFAHEGLTDRTRGVTMCPWLAPTAIPLLATLTAAIGLELGSQGDLCISKSLANVNNCP